MGWGRGAKSARQLMTARDVKLCRKFERYVSFQQRESCCNSGTLRRDLVASVRPTTRPNSLLPRDRPLPFVTVKAAKVLGPWKLSRVGDVLELKEVGPMGSFAILVKREQPLIEVIIESAEKRTMESNNRFEPQPRIGPLSQVACGNSSIRDCCCKWGADERRMLHFRGNWDVQEACGVKWRNGLVYLTVAGVVAIFTHLPSC